MLHSTEDRREKYYILLKEDVEGGTNNEYQLISNKYIDSYNKVTIKHKKCGTEYEVLPNNFKRGKRCPNCYGNKKLNFEDIKNSVERDTNNAYKLISKEYVNVRTKIRVLHKECGTEYLVTPKNFRAGYRCPNCFKSLKYTINDVKEVIESGTSNEYKLLSNYKGAKENILIKHDINGCGHEYFVRFNSFKAGNRCPRCSGVYKDYEIFKKEVEEGTNHEYQLISEEYIKSSTKVKIVHKNCGNIYEVIPSSVINGNRCPNCNSSKGETLIKNILGDLKINHIREYKKIKNPYTDRYLPIDFAIFDKEKLIGCIEYDGYQHYYPVEHFGGESNYYKTITRDYIKDCWCKSKNIPFLRIPYWEEDVEGLVEKYINCIKNEELYKELVDELKG